MGGLANLKKPAKFLEHSLEYISYEIEHDSVSAVCRAQVRVGNGISFRKNSADSLGTDSVIPRKKVLIPTEF